MKKMKRNMAQMSKKTGKKGSSTDTNNVIELNLNQIKPFEDFDLDFDHQNEVMQSSEKVRLT